MTNINFKVFLLTIGLTTAKAQNIKDFYMPDLIKYNKASFYYEMKNMWGPVRITDEYYYEDNKDGTFNKIVVYGRQEDNIVGIIRQTIEFGTNEVWLIEAGVQSIVPEDNQITTRYKPPRVLLKMPPVGHTATWTIYGEQGEAPTKHTSSWTTIKVEGQNRKCIKVISVKANIKLVHYYAEGVGFIKEESIDEFGVTKTKKDYNLSYEPTKAEKEEQRRKKEERKREITSKTYDLAQYDIRMYEQALFQQRMAIIDFFIKSPDEAIFIPFQELEKRKLKYERFKNTYSVFYESIPNQGETRIVTTMDGTRYVSRNIKAELIEGTDEKCSLFTYASIKPPKLEIEGFEVNTITKFDNVKIDFTRGITEVKITNGNVSFKKYKPEIDLQPILIEKLKEKSNGKYKVKYEIGNIIDYEVRNIEAIK